MAGFGTTLIDAYKRIPLGVESPGGSPAPSDSSALVDDLSGVFATSAADRSPLSVLADLDVSIEFGSSSATSAPSAATESQKPAAMPGSTVAAIAPDAFLTKENPIPMSSDPLPPVASSPPSEIEYHETCGWSIGKCDIHHVTAAADDNTVSLGAEDQAVAAAAGTIAQLADYLVNGYWQRSGNIGHHWASSTISVNMTDLTVAEQALAVSALRAYQDVANISFTFTTGAANITYNNNGSGQAVTSSSWTGSGNMTGATIDISADWWPNDNIYSYMYQTYLHETGHALGLGHQGPYNGSATYGVSNIFTNDTWQYSIMSYFPQNNFGGTYDYVITPEMADITAMQTMYGTASATRTGNTTYGFNSNAGSIFDFAQYSGTPAFTLYDSGGSDTLDCSGYSMAGTINLNGGTWSSIGGYVNNIGIFTTTTIENVIGGSGGDTLIGNSVDNTFRGRAGNDTIDGAGGTDSALFSGLRAAYILTDLSNGSVRVSGPDGTDTLTSVERLVFDDQTVSWPLTVPPVPPVPSGVFDHDFNGDGRSDFLWQNTNSGAVFLWFMDGANFSPTGFLGGTGNPSWHAVSGRGDFNGDGKSDIVWQNTSSGAVSLWFMDGANFSPTGFLGGSGSPDWHVVGTGDFNGDGKSDLVWQNTSSGAVSLWLMDGASFSPTGFVGGSGSPDWHVVETGDFNGDGKSDLVWQNTSSGAVSLWFMDGANFSPTGFLGGNGNPDWHVAGTGDFNGDGKSDLVWQQTSTGAVSEWFMDGANFSPTGFLGGNGVPDWHIIG